MNFRDTFRAAAKSKMMANMECSPSLLVPNCYEPDLSISDNMSAFAHILGGGRISANQLFSFSFKPMNAYIAIYTTEGGGRISISGTSYHISDGNLVIIDCHHEFSVQALMLPWNFKIFFFDGEHMDMYKQAMLPFTRTPVCSPAEFSPAVGAFDQLMRIPLDYDIKGLMLMHQSLTTILTYAYISSLNDSSAIVPSRIPSYLVELKDTLDNHYEEPFSLTACEEIFKISKFRICKEFSAYFNASPLNYLNKRRIEIAKEMLLTTDYNIYEVSSRIGIENVNHFINLFKKNVGLTPNVFRQQARAQRFS